MFGVDRIHDIGGELGRLERKRPLVLCSWRRRRSEEFRHLVGGLGLTPNVFPGAEEHVPRTVVEAAWRAAQEHEADAVISFGGGSTIDLGKAVALVAERGLEAFDGAEETGTDSSREAPPAMQGRALAHVAVPLTYSGAEATACSFVSDRQEKLRLAGPRVRPDLVVSDPALTLALPWKPTGGTGMTALAHCVEALCSSPRTEWTDSLATRAARSLFRLLPVVSTSPQRVMERSEMLGAAYVAGVVSDVAGRGLHHALCIGLGARTGVAHGLASAILLPHVMRFDLEAATEGLTRVAEAIDAGGPAQGPDRVEAMAATLGLPRRLREVGVFEQDLDTVAAGTGRGSPEVWEIPRPVSVDDALAVLRAAW